ncbi:MAG: phosphoglycerate kinase [Oscillospiraceae bacterium]|nr:phosphoglycerate kinase [Oscillospiraceae bacterium]
MMKKTVRDIDVRGKKVLVRCDFNVPQDKETLEITDNRRIREAIPTIKYLIDNGAKVILCSHLGRPKGKFDPRYSLKPIAEELSMLLNMEVKMTRDVVGESARSLTSNMQEGEIVLLENVRFMPLEEENDSEYSKELASLADLYVNDAFGTAHRAQSSTEGVSKFIPAVSGFLIEKEIEFLGKTLDNPERPFVAILGGAKVSDKIAVIENLLDKVDTLIIGGGMAYTFFKAQGHNIGTSICEDDKLDLANSILAKAEQKNVDLLLPIDNIIAKEYSNDSETGLAESGEIPDGYMGLDIGPKSIDKFREVLANAKTVVWNGPMGVFEFSNFAIGTYEIGKALADMDGTTIIGGGDSAAAVEQSGLSDRMTHISTGGGASLEFLEGKILPGIACLEDKV